MSHEETVKNGEKWCEDCAKLAAKAQAEIDADLADPEELEAALKDARVMVKALNQ